MTGDERQDGMTGVRATLLLLALGALAGGIALALAWGVAAFAAGSASPAPWPTWLRFFVALAGLLGALGTLALAFGQALAQRRRDQAQALLRGLERGARQGERDGSAGGGRRAH